MGDLNAVRTAYPKMKTAPYRQDSVCGTWEALADAVYGGGCKALKKQGYFEQGKQKIEWANRIGSHLDLYNNLSPSFNHFIAKLDSFCT